ncbi:4-hydroxy-4-methyl-2-oxoglutarate aldolase [Oxalobacteraceae bacterium GrIS 2.11]
MNDFDRNLNTVNVSTTHLCDANSSVRLISSLKPIVKKRFSGIARTVNAMGDIMPIWKAIDSAQAGSVLVIDAGNSKNAVFDEFYTSFARARRIAGVVLFGFCRDSDSIRELGVPFYAMGHRSRVGTKNQIGEIGGVLKIDDVTITEGDYVIGDSDGIVIMSPTEFKDTLPGAIEIMEKENYGLAHISNYGSTINEIFNFREHYEKLLANEKSVLSLL